MAAFSDVTEPTASLRPPAEPEEFSQGWGLDLFNDCGDLVSPTYWVTEAYNAVFGFNPLDEVLESIAGDWEGFAKCADVWDQLGQASDALSQNITAGNATLDRTWDGRAADGACLYFSKLAGRLDELKEEFGKLHAEYDRLTHAAYSAFEAVKGYLGGIIDGLLIAAVEMAAGTALSWSGAGALLGYGLAALEITDMLSKWGLATKRIAAVQMMLNGGVGIVEGIGAAIYGLFVTFDKLGQYDHPAATV
ncbi:hypothetical protein ACFW9D_21145 [Streptomyces sp. NPDC059524]|uniref:hypothetical protein n=1 Tax=Streptomyces sp. NPDC059524 TaxID=3346856 RepID=UPI0036973F3E